VAASPIAIVSGILSPNGSAHQKPLSLKLMRDPSLNQKVTAYDQKEETKEGPQQEQ